ncbi:MAG: tetratricopeptide repeat protein, partial [Actinobacteria bacterium]|nr:tetratricopeptide repeat protein [Actinomycetota bacterium]
LDAFRTIGRRSGEAWALQNLAWISFSRGRIAEAGERLAASLAIFEEVGMPNGAAWALGLQGFVRLAEGDLAGAEALQSKVLAEAEVGGERWAVAMMLLLGATIRLWTGRTVEAVDMATDGLERFRAVQDRFGQARILWPLARALAMRGEPEPARIALDDLRRSIDHDTVVVARSASAEDRMVLTMASASVEVHLGNPEDALAAMASLAEELGAPAVAAGLRGLARGGEPADDDVSSIESWVRSTLGFGAGSEPFTIVAGALLQTGNVAAAAVVVDTVEGHGDTDSSSAPFQAAVALVRAVQGHATQAAMAAASVAADERASYLDRAFAGVAAGLAGVRSGDGTVVRDGFEAARSAVAPTGDLLTRALVAYATARARVAMGADPADPRAVEAAHARLAELGTDAHGWVTLIDCALDADAPAGV